MLHLNAKCPTNAILSMWVRLVADNSSDSLLSTPTLSSSPKSQNSSKRKINETSRPMPTEESTQLKRSKKRRTQQQKTVVMGSDQQVTPLRSSRDTVNVARSGSRSSSSHESILSDHAPEAAKLALRSLFR